MKTVKTVYPVVFANRDIIALPEVPIMEAVDQTLILHLMIHGQVAPIARIITRFQDLNVRIDQIDPIVPTIHTIQVALITQINRAIQTIQISLIRIIQIQIDAKSMSAVECKMSKWI
jgi:hypothetical protein